MRSERELLAATRRDPRAFGEFYARHERAVFRYYYRRTRDVELAADLSAECFAAAPLASRRFRPGGAGGRLAVRDRSQHPRPQRGASPRRVARPGSWDAGAEPEDDTIAALERIHAGQLLENALTYLPADQAEAVQARIVDEREYDDIARELQHVRGRRAQARLARPRSLRRHVEDQACPTSPSSTSWFTSARCSRVRRRTKGVRAAALVAVVALAVVALPRIDGQDVEIPAVPPPTPTATPTTIEAAYGVFRRPARPTHR